MAQERIKNNSGRTVGFVETDSNGKTSLFDHNSRLLGTEKGGHVCDKNSRTVGYNKGLLYTLLK